MQISLIVAYIIGLAALYFIGWLLLVPLKFLSRLMLNGLLGGVLLLALNAASGALHMEIAVNYITALAAGFLGIPGVVLVAVLPMML